MSMSTQLAMSPALLEQYRIVKKLMTEANGQEILARHKVGVVIGNIRRSTDKYGQRAVAQIAAGLGCVETTLYRYASVAETWPETELHVLLSRQNKHGLPLSWSHLLTLSTIADATERNKLTDLALAEGLGVRELARHAHGTTDQKPSAASLCEEQGGDNCPAESDRIEDLLSEIVKISRAFKIAAERCEEALSVQKSEAGVPNDGKRSLSKLVNDALSAQLQLQEAANRALRQLRTFAERIGGPGALKARTARRLVEPVDDADPPIPRFLAGIA